MLSSQRFADDANLLATDGKDLSDQLNKIDNEGRKVGMNIHRGKTKYMTTLTEDATIEIDHEKIERVNSYNYIGQTIHMKDTTKKAIEERIRIGWSNFGKSRNILQDKDIPMNLKKQVSTSAYYHY